jgi:ribosomal protein S18 acetylase RimI-like enzyme
MEFKIRRYVKNDEEQVLVLWKNCNLIVPQNDPQQDIAAKMAFQPELFLVGELNGSVIASIMIGYEGHRGWINYMGVDPSCQQRGYGKKLVQRACDELKKLGCLKVNLQVRDTNREAIGFYKKLGFADDSVVSLGKRLKMRRGKHGAEVQET